VGSIRLHGLLAIAFLSAAPALAGCGRDADVADTQAVAERFFSALQSGDGEHACAQLSPDTRSELESQEQRACREAVTELPLEGGDVTRVEVFVTNAKVDFSSGEAAFLDQGAEGWRLSAVGCTAEDGKATDRPYDCELQA
jgi:hypothetical protein